MYQQNIIMHKQLQPPFTWTTCESAVELRCSASICWMTRRSNVKLINMIRVIQFPVEVSHNFPYFLEERKWSRCHVRLFATPWTVAHQAPLSMGFSRSGLPLPSPGDHPNPGIQPRSPSLQADALTSEPPGKTKMKLLNCVRLFETPWTVAYQTSPSMGFSRQEYWSGVPLPSPGIDIYILLYIK